jgi:hypothetical protein
MITEHDERVQSLIVAALTAAMGEGPWSGDIDGDTITTDRPWGVLQTNNEGTYWLAAETTRDQAIATSRACVEQSSGAYAWWPIAIFDTESGAIEIVEVRVVVTTRPTGKLAA